MRRYAYRSYAYWTLMKTWSEREYADPVPYLEHRAELIVSLGPPLVAGDRVCELACGDGGLADFLSGIEYFGVDADPRKVEEARSKGRPFFCPRTVALPRPVGVALVAAGRSGPLARLALRFRFTYLVAASR